MSERRWKLYDLSESYVPRWVVGCGSVAVANEYAEVVEVMPVAEHEAALTITDEKVERAIAAAFWQVGRADQELVRTEMRATLRAALSIGNGLPVGGEA